MISKNKRLFSRDIQPVDERLYFRGKDRLSGEESVDFCNRPVPVEAGIENVELPIAPSTIRRATLKRIAALTRYAPHWPRERIARERVDAVKYRYIAGPA